MFTQIKRTAHSILQYLDRCADALERIYGTLAALVDAVHALRLPGSGDGAVSEDPRINVLLAQVGDLTVAVAEGIKNVQRSENRVRSIVKGARRELAAAGFDHAGVEAEARELQLVDVEDRPEEPVQPVHEDVEPDQQAASSIAGVSREALARARGM